MPRESFFAAAAHPTDQLHVDWSAGQVVLVDEAVADRTVAGAAVRLQTPFSNADALDRFIGVLRRARRDAFGKPRPTAAVVEIVEAGDRRTDDGAGGLIVPTEVRIQGIPLFTQGGVKIHEIDLRRPEMATVTLTLCARRITVAADGDLAAAETPK